MQRRWFEPRLTVFLACSLGVALMGATPVGAACDAPPEWLPSTPAPDFSRPPPHQAPDCVFYTPAWHTFLHVLQPAPDGKAAFLSYPTIADVFGPISAQKVVFRQSSLLSLSPRAFKGSNDPSSDPPGRAGPSSPSAINAGVRQAGLDGLLIDQNGRPIFYAIHMNSAFEAFVRSNGLTTKAAVQGADPELVFPKGVVELKSAWQIVEGGAVPSNYVTARALVPQLKVVSGRMEIDETAPPREADVAMLALHVAFVVEGHPEFVWATFEHVDDKGEGDLAPLAGAPPSQDTGLPDGVDGPISARGFTLYKSGTLASAANTAIDESAMVSAFDAASQRFLVNGVPLQTSIYRYFPTSKTTDAKGAQEDGDITDLNKSVRALFDSVASGDKRRNYRLVGAIWLDKPETFTVGKPIRNPSGMTTDDPAAAVAGEDGLSSLAMESFTQNSFPNCFSCHDTRAVKDSSGKLLMPAKKLNVSHIFSNFVSQTK